MTAYHRSGRVLGATLALYAILVATNQGEFWPFSIYPMFSRAGSPWARAVVREVPDDSMRWEPVTLDELPGKPYPLADYGINYLDLGSLVVQTETWDAERIELLRGLLGLRRGGQRRLAVLRAVGHIAESDSVVVIFEPYFLMTPERAIVAPGIVDAE